jgi:hypothetical protein
MAGTEEKDLSEFVRFVIAVARNQEIPKTKLSEKLFLAMPDEDREQFERIALENGLIDPDELFYKKAGATDWKSLPDNELIQRIDEYFRYRYRGSGVREFRLDLPVEWIQRRKFLFVKTIVERKEIKEQDELCYLLNDLVSTSGGDRAGALCLAEFLVERGSGTKMVSECHLGKVANIDVKASAQKLPSTDPVAQFIAGLPDQPDPKGWNEDW